MGKINSFWRKKAIVSYMLAIFVFFIHMPCFGQYCFDESLISCICYQIGQYLKNSACFAVPLFFIISGALFFRNYDNSKYFDKLKKRMNSLAIPYLVWNTVWMLFAIVTSLFFAHYFIARQPFDPRLSNVIKAIFLHTQNGPFWFVEDLLIFVVLSPVFYVLLRTLYPGGVFLLIFLYYFDVLPDWILFDSSSCIYYAIGAVVGMYYPNLMNRLWSKKESIVAMATFMLTTVMLHLMQIGMIEFEGKFFDTVMLIMRLVAAFSFWIMSDLFMSSIPDREYFNYSFWVYAMHINVGAIVSKLVYIALPKASILSIVNFIVTIPLTLLIINTIAKIIQINVPKLYTALSGGR